MKPRAATSKLLSLLSRSAGALSLCAALGATETQPPPNGPAAVEWHATEGRLTLRYHHTEILNATVRAERPGGDGVPGTEIGFEPAVTNTDKVEQRLKFTLLKPSGDVSLVLRGTVTGSDEAFPAETDGPAQQRFPLVRTSVGLSYSLRNNAVYDRHWDWMLMGPGDGATRIMPKAAREQASTFMWERSGANLELVFRPRFYQKHRGLACFEPWTYRVWKSSVSGYCTWWAYRDGFDQQTLDAMAVVFAEKKLPEFGYKYFQIDDSYQIGNGSCPQNWLAWNDKFPGGAAYAIRKIRSAGMEPGIWVHRVHRPSDPHVADLGKQHPYWFVQKTNGTLFADGGFYLLNTKNKDALDGMARPIYRELKQQGWGYVKIDGAGDLLYAYRNPLCAEHFRRIGSTPEESLRDWDRVAREELGPSVYILNCWGVQPGASVIGLVDGCRVGADGFTTTGLQKFNSLNGVVWRADPDHCDILAKGFKEKTTMKTFGARAAIADTIEQPGLVAMAGAALMVSDKLEDYRDNDNLEGMKRSSPVLFTVPGQLYDFGNRRDKDLGPAWRGGEATWWLLEIDRPFDHWLVLARFNWRQEKLKWRRPGNPEQEVKFLDLGLAGDREYLVFEFSTQRFLGRCKGSFTAPPQDENNAMQVFAIREARAYPWVISTTRHLSQDAVSLLDEHSDPGKKTLSGRSALIVGDPYVLTAYLPRGFRLKTAALQGEQVEMANQEETATARVVPLATGTVNWTLSFAAE